MSALTMACCRRMASSNMPAAEHLKLNDAIFASRPNGTDVYYYIFPEHEIHFNVIKAHTKQEWHSHSLVDENIFVIKGTLHSKRIRQP